MTCAQCQHSAYRTESTMTCNYGVAPVIKLRSDTCEQFSREPGTEGDDE